MASRDAMDAADKMVDALNGLSEDEQIKAIALACSWHKIRVAFPPPVTFGRQLPPPPPAPPKT